MGNSRQLPTYEKSVAIQVTQQPDPSGPANAMINAFRNFSQDISQISQGISKEQAQQQREILKNNISNTYRGFALEALKNPDQNAALESYNQSSRQYAQGLMEQSDHYNKPYVSNLVDYYHNEHMYTIEKNAIMQNKRMESADAYSRINLATVDWKDAINNSVPMIDENGEDHQFDAAKALFADQIKNIKINAQMGLIRPERLGDATAKLTKEFTDSMFLKRYEDHVANGTGDEYIRELQNPNTNIPGYGIEDKTKLIGQMIHIRDQGKSSARIAIGQIKQQMNDEVKRVADGGMPNTQLQEQVQALDETTYKQLMEDTSVAQQVYSSKQAAFYKSPEEVAKLKSGLLNIDPNDPEYGHLRRVADASIKAIDLQTKQFRQNPMKETMKDPAIQESVNTYQQAFNSNSVGDPNHMNTPFNSTVPKPWNSIIQSQLHRGLTINGTGSRQGSAGSRVRLLDNAQVPEMVNNIMQATPKQKIQLMNRWNDEYGGGLAFNLVVKQLVDGGMPAQFSLLANIDPNSKEAADVAQAFSLPYKELSSELHKKDGQSVTTINNLATNDVFGQVQGKLGKWWSSIAGSEPRSDDAFKSFLNTTTRYSGDVDREYYNSIATTVQQLAYYYTLTQNMGESDAVKKAENVIASRYDYTTIDNQEVRIPHDTTGDIVKTYAAKIAPQVETFPWNTKGYDKDYAKELIRQGHWKNDSADHGLVWVDANGKLWSDANGQPLSFSFDEAKTGIRHIDTPPASKIPESQDQSIDSGYSQPALVVKQEAYQPTQEDEMEQRNQEMQRRGKIAGQRFHNLMQSVKKDNK
jgi:hypothetical protein